MYNETTSYTNMHQFTGLGMNPKDAATITMLLYFESMRRLSPEERSELEQLETIRDSLAQPFH